MLYFVASSTGVHSGVVNSQTTCSPDVLVLGNVDTLYEAAVRASEQTKSPGQVSSGHPVFPVTLPDLTSPPPPLPSPSKINTAGAPLSAAVGSNRPVAAVTAMNNNATDPPYKTAVGVGSSETNRTTSVPAATIESLNKRMQGLSLCNADLLRQLADKDKQLQRIVKTMNVQDQELDAARREIVKLKEQKVKVNLSSKTDDSDSSPSAEQIKRSSINNNDTATTSTENQLIISLQKQLESEKLNSRNLKQQLDLERLYATRISDKQNFLYNKANQNTSGHKTNVGNSSLLGHVSQNKLENTLTSNFGSSSDSFGLRGLLANTATQQHSTHNTDIFEGLLGSDDTFKALTNQSSNNVSINPPPISTPSPIPSSLRPANGRHTNNTMLNTAINPQAPTGFSPLAQHSFSRSEQLTSGLNRSNSTGASTSSNRHNLYNVPSSSNSLDHNSASSSTAGTIGGSGLSLFGFDDSTSLLRSNSIADATATETSSSIYSSVIGVTTPSHNSTGSNEDMYTKMANLR